jgi:hypothetical protein
MRVVLQYLAMYFFLNIYITQVLLDTNLINMINSVRVYMHNKNNRFYLAFDRL